MYTQWNERTYSSQNEIDKQIGDLMTFICADIEVQIPVTQFEYKRTEIRWRHSVFTSEILARCCRVCTKINLICGVVGTRVGCYRGGVRQCGGDVARLRARSLHNVGKSGRTTPGHLASHSHFVRRRSLL